MDVTEIKKHVYPMCRKFAKNNFSFDADDLFQEIVMKLLPYEEVGLLKYKARQLLTDLYRYSKRRRMESLEGLASDGSEIKNDYPEMRALRVSAEDIDELNTIMSLALLDSEEQKLLYERFYLGWTLDAIGRIRGLKKNTISLKLKLTIEKIRKVIE